MSSRNTVVPSQPAASPRARVKLDRVNSQEARPHPPESQKKGWLQRLKKALGTQSFDFVVATLAQLVGAARLPHGGISEHGVNAALSIIESAEPRNEIEAISAIQLACTHAVTMVVFSRLAEASGRQMPALASAAARLVRASALQSELLRKLKGGQSQYVRVEHVHVNEGGQAVIGNVKTGATRTRRGKNKTV